MASLRMPADFMPVLLGPNAFQRFGPVGEMMILFLTLAAIAAGLTCLLGIVLRLCCGMPQRQWAQPGPGERAGLLAGNQQGQSSESDEEDAADADVAAYVGIDEGFDNELAEINAAEEGDAQTLPSEMELVQDVATGQWYLPFNCERNLDIFIAATGHPRETLTVTRCDEQWLLFVYNQGDQLSLQPPSPAEDRSLAM